MKKIILISLILVEVFVNEFSLVYLSSDNNIGSNNIVKIRFFNLIIFITIILIHFYYKNFIKIKLFYKFLILILYFLSIDILSRNAEFGYPKNEKDSLRYIFPYDWIRGEPNKLDHNKYGFRGKPPDLNRDYDKFIIGFFGGSTGYQGDPPIINIVSSKLNEINIKNEIINFSSVSSNHNQHLHRLLEFSEFSYDLIIFYGGGNESITHYYYDSRPGYPYNFYLYDKKTNDLVQLLTKYSNLIGEIDKIFSIYLEFNPKTSNEIDFKNWVNETKQNYFNTIKKTKNLSEKMLKPNRCKNTFFLPIFQPLNPLNDRTKILVQSIKKDLKENEIYNFSNLEKELIFTDFIHIDQNSKEIVANQIFKLVKKIFENKDNCKN